MEWVSGLRGLGHLEEVGRKGLEARTPSEYQSVHRMCCSGGGNSRLRVGADGREGTRTTAKWPTMALGILRWCLGHLRDVWRQDLGARTPPDYQNEHQMWCSVGINSGLRVVPRAIEGTRTTDK
mgnify:CR=1 FL=1